MNVYPWRDTNRAPIGSSELPALLYRDRTESKTEGAGIFENVLPIEIEIYGSTPAQIRECIAELEKKVLTDPTWGGLALWTELDTNEMEIQQKENIFVASKIIMAVQYRTVWGDPYTQA